MNNLASQTSFLFRRELWENKGGAVWTPVALATAAIALILLSLVFGVDDFSRHLSIVVEWSGQAGADGEETRRIDFSRGELVAADEDLDWTLWGSQIIGVLTPTLHSIAVGFELVAFVVVVFYLLGGLYNDRKDRTILFWKSLPFSETHGVLVKLLFAAFFIPLVALLAVLAVQVFFTGATVFLITNTTSFSAADILGNVSLISVFVGHLLLVLVVTIKNLPLYAWLMFASAISRKSPFLTAILPPMIIVTLEGLIFGSDYAATFLHSFALDTGIAMTNEESTASLLRSLVMITPLQLAKIAVVSVPLLYATIWLRNNRFEI
jgi:ABC-2 type transport system permease protein